MRSLIAAQSADDIDLSWIHYGNHTEGDVKLVRVVAGLVAAVIFTACGETATSSEVGANRDEKLVVYAVNYPLAWLAERIGGEHVAASGLADPIPVYVHFRAGDQPIVGTSMGGADYA